MTKSLESPLLTYLKRVAVDEQKVRYRDIVEAFRRNGWSCSDALVSYWCNGQRLPGRKNQLRLEKITGGQVTAQDWISWYRTCESKATRRVA